MTSNKTSQIWLITGCSSGLGALLVQAARQDGHKVIATARDLQSISMFDEDDGIRTLQLDVTDSQEILDQRIKEAIGFFGRIDVLVNNAGYILCGVWEQMSEESILRQFDCNVFGPLRLTRALLPHLRGGPPGRSLVFIGSMAGWVGGPTAGPYAASKFALEGAVECLQKEIAGFNIQVYMVALGEFRTGVLNASRRKYSEEKPLPEYEDLISSLMDRHENKNGNQRGDPARAARRIVEILRADEQEKSGGKDSNSLPTLSRVFLGPDCVNAIQNKCEETLKLIEEHRELFSSTDYPEAPRPQIKGYEWGATRQRPRDVKTRRKFETRKAYSTQPCISSTLFLSSRSASPVFIDSSVCQFSTL